MSLNMRVSRVGEDEGGKTVSVGTVVEYQGHVPGGMVRVRLPDGKLAFMHPACFDELTEPVLASRTPECMQEDHLTTRDEEGM